MKSMLLALGLVLVTTSLAAAQTIVPEATYKYFVPDDLAPDETPSITRRIDEPFEPETKYEYFLPDDLGGFTLDLSITRPLDGELLEPETVFGYYLIEEIAIDPNGLLAAGLDKPEYLRYKAPPPAPETLYKYYIPPDLLALM